MLYLDGKVNESNLFFFDNLCTFFAFLCYNKWLIHAERYFKPREKRIVECYMIYLPTNAEEFRAFSWSILLSTEPPPPFFILIGNYKGRVVFSVFVYTLRQDKLSWAQVSPTGLGRTLQEKAP